MVSRTAQNKAVTALRRGGIIIFPTETAYGIGCDATNAAAVRRVYRIQSRERGKPLPVVAADIRQARRFFRLDGPALELAERHWPGPLTIVLPASDARIRRALGASVGVRVSSHPIARRLAAGLARPIVATSANLSGRPACYSLRAVKNQLGKKPIDFYLDAGVLLRHKPSTVVRVESDGSIRILRRGPIDPSPTN